VVVTRYRAAKWIVGAVIALLMPGFIAAFLGQVSSFLGVAVRGPIPEPSSAIESLWGFSRQLGFILVLGGSLGILLAFKAERIPRIGALAWYVHLVGHELVHALFAKLCGYKIKQFKFTRQGGYVSYHKPNARGNFLIALSPYLFPLFPILLILIAAALRGPAQGAVVFLLGAALGSHLAGTASEALDQYDLRQVGLFFSVMFVVLVNNWLVVFVMAVVSPARASVTGFVADALAIDAMYLGLVARFFAGLLR